MSAQKKKVLLVDDSPLGLDAASFVLGREGYEVRTASAVSEIDEVLRQWSPDLVVTDVHMPGTGPNEICALLKARATSGPLTVILYSGLSDDELEKLSAEVGADGYVSKVGGLKRLVARLEEIFAGDRTS